MFLLILSILIVFILVSLSFLYADNFNDASGISKQTLSEIQAENIDELSKTNSGIIYINNSSVILIEQSPSMGSMNSSPEEYFVIDELVNPTLIIKSGISIRFIIVNMDDMEHNFAITNFPPPYPYIIMGGNMMYNVTHFTLNTPYLQPYNGGDKYPSETVIFKAQNPGEFWYLCTYPGHAQEGMYGKLIISND